MTLADSRAEQGDGRAASRLPFSLAIGHHASDEVLASVQRVTGLRSRLLNPSLGDASAIQMASDPTVPSYDDPQPDPPTAPSYDSPQPDGPTVPSADTAIVG
jgi:hypothetical protein